MNMDDRTSYMEQCNKAIQDVISAITPEVIEEYVKGVQVIDWTYNASNRAVVDVSEFGL